MRDSLPNASDSAATAVAFMLRPLARALSASAAATLSGMLRIVIVFIWEFLELDCTSRLRLQPQMQSV